ncbi:hypothetical protein [Marinicella sp. W31]|uniref:hypothetical protein n=1 Tax=Marinicella sp. W31 TaxID=3023713 RepID=UPI0037563C5E
MKNSYILLNYTATKKIILFLITIPIVMLLSGCPGTKKLTTPIDNFNQIVESGTELVQTELKFKPSVRRDEAIVFYLINGNDPTNISSENVNRSFANYVCAGSSSLSSQLHALNFAAEYARTAKNIARPASDDFVDQWARYLELKQEVPLLEPNRENNSSSIRKSCIDSIQKLIPPTGKVATDVSDEIATSGVIAAYAATKELLNSLKGLATRGLSVVNEAKAFERLKEFVNKNHENVKRILGSDLRPDQIDDAWERRKARSLIRPYYLFSELLKRNHPEIKMSNVEILEVATRIEIQLQEYDAISATQSPSKIIVGIAISQEKLFEAVNDDNYQSESLISFFDNFIGDLKSIKESYDEVKLKAREARLAFGEL